MIPEIIIITGERGEGKTSFVSLLVEGLRKSNHKVSGIIAPGFWKDNRRERFDLINLSNNKRITYCQIDYRQGWEKIRQFYINPQGQAFGEKALKHTNFKRNEVIIVDELGPFELEGKAWSSAIKKLLNLTETCKLFVVRKSLVNEITAYFKMENYAVFSICKHTPDDIIQVLSNRI